MLSAKPHGKEMRCMKRPADIRRRLHGIICQCSCLSGKAIGFMALPIKIKIDGVLELSVAHRCERNQGHQRGVSLFPMRPAKVRRIRVDTKHFHVAFDRQTRGLKANKCLGQLAAVSDACVSGVAFEISGAMFSSTGDELVRLRRYQIVLIQSSRYLLSI